MRLLQAYFMAIKDYVVTQRHYLRQCYDYVSFTTNQAMELMGLKLSMKLD